MGVPPPGGSVRGHGFRMQPHADGRSKYVQLVIGVTADSLRKSIMHKRFMFFFPVADIYISLM
jgi:hypothetical protein